MNLASFFTSVVGRWLFPVIAIIWFGVALVAINGVGASKFNDFDPELRLSSELMSMSMEKELSAALMTLAIPSPADAHVKDSTSAQSIAFSNVSTQQILSANLNPENGIIIHLYQGDCFCETLSMSHQKVLNEWASKQGIAHINLNLSETPELRRFVPSTPAVIVLNKANKLVYLGPYSTGMGCFQDEGLVDTKIKPYFTRTSTQLRASIQSEAKGCYCATQPPSISI